MRCLSEGNLDTEGVDAVKKSLVEPPFFDLFGQVAVGGEEETDIDRALLLFPHPPVGAGLQHPQE